MTKLDIMRENAHIQQKVKEGIKAKAKEEQGKKEEQAREDSKVERTEAEVKVGVKVEVRMVVKAEEREGTERAEEKVMEARPMGIAGIAGVGTMPRIAHKKLMAYGRVETEAYDRYHACVRNRSVEEGRVAHGPWLKAGPSGIQSSKRFGASARLSFGPQASTRYWKKKRRRLKHLRTRKGLQAQQMTMTKMSKKQ